MKSFRLYNEAIDLVHLKSNFSIQIIKNRWNMRRMLNPILGETKKYNNTKTTK